MRSLFASKALSCPCGLIARFAFLILIGCVCLPLEPVRADEMAYRDEPISYFTAESDNPITRTQDRMAKGQVKLRFDRQRGYLVSLLEALDIPVSSQSLVFSKTSFQAARITPRAPRAVYFNDDVYVGWVPGTEVLEISAADPALGGVFYTLSQTPGSNPMFMRQTHACLSCHVSGATSSVPGHLVRSVFPQADGMPAYNAGTFVTGHESPFTERWGGWYVTGSHGDQRHMGNVFVRDRDNPEDLDRDSGANVSTLSGRLDIEDYPAPSSDIVALLVLEHQTQMHNRIAAASFQARMALHYQRGINKSMGLPNTEVWPSTIKRIEGPAEDLVKYLLFCGEAKLTAAVSGSPDFAKAFTSKGPTDGKGRSLREFDLKTRLFRYPCSYLIYSEAFAALPEESLVYIARRIDEILSGKDLSEAFAHLSAEDRLAIREILKQTAPVVAGRWSG